jgi:hypothetical protein
MPRLCCKTGDCGVEARNFCGKLNALGRDNSARGGGADLTAQGPEERGSQQLSFPHPCSSPFPPPPPYGGQELVTQPTAMAVELGRNLDLILKCLL